MAAAGIGRQSRLCVILVKVGTPVARVLFEKRVKDLTPSNHNPSVDEFLLAKIPKIRSLKLKSQVWSKIFPVQSHVVMLQQLDLSLLCTILTECCDLLPDIKLYIHRLRQLRNKFVHMDNSSIDDHRYQHYLTILKMIFDRCLKEINDDAFTTEMNKMFEKLEQGQFSQVDAEEVMKKLQSMPEETNVRLYELGQNQQSMNEKLDDLVQQILVLETSLESANKLKVPVFFNDMMSNVETGCAKQGYQDDTADLQTSVTSKVVQQGEKDFSTPDILANDPYTRNLYEQALEEGTEEDNSIRVMVIGCYGQGKTSLVRRLVKQPLNDVMTTNGIEVQRCKCSKDGVWEAQILEDLEVESSKRLAYVAKSAEERINEETGKKQDFVPLVTNNTEVKENTAVTLSTTTEEESLNCDKKMTEEILKADQSNMFMDQENHVTGLKIFSAELERHRQTSNVSKESDISLNIWDFGGQFVYYATHQVFLSRKSVYILVFNIAEGLDKTISDPDFPGRSCNMTMRDYLRFWVTSVHSFVGAEDGTEPTIIMVGTHKDEIKEGINTDDIFEDIRKMFDDTSAINHFHSDQFVVSNTSSADESIDILRKTVLDVGRRQARKVAVPAKWILLEKELKKIQKKKIVTLEEVLEVDRGNYSQVQTETQDAKNDQIRLFLRYHHALGSFCYFDDRNLSEYIVVDPQFLIDAFSCIVTSEQFCRVRNTLRKKWRKLCETAILEPELLEEVWRKNPGEEFHKFKKLLIEFLQKHRIISEVLKYDEKGATSPQPLGFYIVPSFLKVSASVETVGDFLDGKPTTDVSLGYIFENEAITPTLYQNLLAAVVGRWPLLKFTGQYILFNNMVACELQSDHAGLLIQTQNKLELLIVNLCPVNSIRPDVCDMFRRFVEMVIEHVFCRFRGYEEYASQRVFTKYVRCFHKQHGFKGSEGILELTDIQSQSDRHFPCPDRASHSLEVNHICQQWYGHQVTAGDIPKRRLTEKQYSALSMGIGQGWQQIGHQLGLGDISLQHIDMDYKTTDMKIFYMFLKWDANELDRATLDVLVKAIQECRQIASVNWDVVKNIVDGF